MDAKTAKEILDNLINDLEPVRDILTILDSLPQETQVRIIKRLMDMYGLVGQSPYVPYDPLPSQPTPCDKKDVAAPFISMYAAPVGGTLRQNWPNFEPKK